MQVNLNTQKTNNQSFGMAIKFKTPEIREKFIQKFTTKNIENSEKLDKFVKLVEREKDNTENIIINDYGYRFRDIPNFYVKLNGEEFHSRILGIVPEKPGITDGDIFDLIEIVANKAQAITKQNKAIEYIKKMD